MAIVDKEVINYIENFLKAFDGPDIKYSNEQEVDDDYGSYYVYEYSIQNDNGKYNDWFNNQLKDGFEFYQNGEYIKYENFGNIVISNNDEDERIVIEITTDPLFVDDIVLDEK